MRRVLLPGMDGTGRLFDRVARPDDLVMSYPTREPLGYDALVDRVRAQLPPGPFALVAESFSGPIAIRLADADGVAGIALVATFARTPVCAPRAAVPRVAFAVSPPVWALALALTGGDRALAATVRDAMDTVSADVLALRLTEILRVDLVDTLARTRVPLLVVVGRRDRLLGARSLREIVAARPDAVVRSVEAPHLVLQAVPSAVDEWPPAQAPPG